MEGINIPMRTKPSMDLRTSFQGNGEERVCPALDLREVQSGVLQRPQKEAAGSVPQRTQREAAGSVPQRSQREAAGSVPQRTQREAAGSVPQRSQREAAGSVPQRSQREAAGSVPQRSQREVTESVTRRPAQGADIRRDRAGAVRHYEVQPKGGAVLNKGGKVSFRSLLPGNPGKIDVVMGWDAPGFSLEDVDASCYLLGENGKVVGDDWFVFYNQPSSPDGAVRHLGKGSGAKEETIVVDFGRLRPEIKRLAFVLTINEAQERGYSFCQVSNAHVRIRDGAGRKELAVFNLSDYYDGVTAMTVCEFYDYHGEWKINPVGHGLKNTGLLELCRFYGVRVE